MKIYLGAIKQALVIYYNAWINILNNMLQIIYDMIYGPSEPKDDAS